MAYNGLTLDAAEHVQLVRALGGMPYLPGTKPGIVAVQDAHDLIRTLEGLADYLREHGQRLAADEREFQQQTTDIRALRRLLGTADA